MMLCGYKSIALSAFYQVQSNPIISISLKYLQWTLYRSPLKAWYWVSELSSEHHLFSNLVVMIYATLWYFGLCHNGTSHDYSMENYYCLFILMFAAKVVYVLCITIIQRHSLNYCCLYDMHLFLKHFYQKYIPEIATCMLDHITYRWVSARNMQLQCISNGVIFFFHFIDIWSHLYFNVLEAWGK